MIKVKLLTRSGEYVATVGILPMSPPPEILAWGTRFFIFSKETNSGLEYTEGLMMGVMEFVETFIPEKVVEKISEQDEESKLMGIPKDLDEAIETFLEFYGQAHDINTIVDYTEEEFRVATHHGAGQFLRNSWYLWWSEGHNYSTWPKTIPPIVKYFHDLGIYHADDMSGIIITSTYRKVHKRDLDVDGQVKYYQDYWKSQGFSDGIPK